MLADLNKVPDNEWCDFKDAFVDCGLDLHPYVIDNNIKLTKQKTSVQNAKTWVALALEINGSPPPSKKKVNVWWVSLPYDNDERNCDVTWSVRRLCIPHVDGIRDKDKYEKCA